jgi:hypothetical protein
MNLELMAMVWLRTEKRCAIVTRERSFRYMAGQPDVIGITKARFVIEIEIKRSVADFRADAKKHHRQNRGFYLDSQPNQFYYLMPKLIADKVESEVPIWAGLMFVDEQGYGCQVRNVAPVNKLSRKVSLKECVRAVEHQTNFILSLERQNDNFKCRFKDGHFPYLGLHPELHYEI